MKKDYVSTMGVELEYLLVHTDGPEQGKVANIALDLLNQAQKDYCYRKVAVAEKDISICDKLQNGIIPEKDWCYNDVNEVIQDLSICDKIQDQLSQVSCYRKIAEAKNDPSICDKIQDQNWRDYCHSRF